MNDHELDIVRRAYAKQIMAADQQVTDERVEHAFATVKREAFLGPGPWPIFRFGKGSYVDSPTADPVYIYTNDVVGIDPERRINNGQPSLHAHLIASAAPAPGDHAVHIGAGVGYYTAILASLVGPTGRVTAIEYEPDLAERASANLAGYANVSVCQGDGATMMFDPANVVYVNAGATRPADSWLDGLLDGGRLVLPLTTNSDFQAGTGANIRRQGAVFLVTREGSGFAARWISPVRIYPCAGMRDELSERALGVALAKGELARVRHLHRTDDVPEELCWLQAPGWCLAYAAGTAD
jgi:protein-L-isoaspartate(D-aspartate) O-methyltransferase